VLRSGPPNEGMRSAQNSSGPSPPTQKPVCFYALLVASSRTGFSFISEWVRGEQELQRFSCLVLPL